MKTLNNITELGALTESELSDIATKLFKRRLSGLKDNFVSQLIRELDNYGKSKYNLLLVNMILNNKLIESKKVIQNENIVMLKWLDSFDRFLYKYHLGYEALYNDYKDKIISYQVDNNYIFNDQFNTKCNKRILERELFIIPSKGYNQLTELRNNIYKCGYCGKQYKKEDALKIEFCNCCRGSEYLDIDNYRLLKLKAISDKSNYKNITIPDYVISDITEQQKATKEKNIKKEIIANKERLKRGIAELKQKTRVLNYLLDNDDFMLLHGIYIYYAHSNTLDFTYKSEKMNNDLKNIVLKYKDDIEAKLNITVKV